MPDHTRDTRRDGLGNRIEYFALTHFKALWQRVQQHSRLQKVVNRALINHAILKIATRPFPLSTMANYTSGTR